MLDTRHVTVFDRCHPPLVLARKDPHVFCFRAATKGVGENVGFGNAGGYHVGLLGVQPP